MLDYDRLASWPISRLYADGNRQLEQDHVDTAMGYYVVLVGKYDPYISRTDKELCATACATLGEIFYAREHYQQAFDFYFKGLRICEENGFDHLLARLHKDIGNIYSVYSDGEQAIKSYNTGLGYARRLGQDDMEVKLLINLVAIYCFNNRLDEARQCYDEMLRFREQDSLVAYFAYQNRALIYAYSDDYARAAECFARAARCADSLRLPPEYVASVNGELAHMYEEMGQADSALRYYRLNSDYTRRHGLGHLLVNNLRGLAGVYESLGQTSLAKHYRYSYLVLADSLLGADALNKMKNGLFLYELDRNYRHITSLTEERAANVGQIRRQRVTLLATVACLLVFAALLVWVWRQKNRLHAAYEALFKRNGEIVRSEEAYKQERTSYLNRIAELEGTVSRLTPGDGREQPVGTVSEAPDKTRRQLLDDTRREELLKRIAYVMEETKDFCRQDFSLDTLAGLVESNSRYVSQVINDTYGKNFRAYLNEYRIREARLRLMDTAAYGHYTIKAIAESVGYKSHTNFINIFKDITGITPSIYQRIAKEQAAGGGEAR